MSKRTFILLNELIFEYLFIMVWSDEFEHFLRGSVIGLNDYEAADTRRDLEERYKGVVPSTDKGQTSKFEQPQKAASAYEIIRDQETRVLLARYGVPIEAIEIVYGVDTPSVDSPEEATLRKIFRSKAVEPQFVYNALRAAHERGIDFEVPSLAELASVCAMPRAASTWRVSACCGSLTRMWSIWKLLSS